jgi:hypothetical protein
VAETLFQRLQDAIQRAATYNSGVQAKPAVVLWSDADQQWLAAIRQLREIWPHLLTLGNYDASAKTGPAIWIKCMIAQTLPKADWAGGEIPVIYLPGVSRLDLRAVETCPSHLQPLAELQYRGVIWGQVNGKDWTINAFLISKKGGLGIDVAQDHATQTAMRRALPQLLESRIDTLLAKRLDAGDFNSLLSPDPVRDLLMWLDHPEEMEQEWRGDRNDAFKAQCRQLYGFDAVADGPLLGAERLAAAEGPWAGVWQRFTESSTGYPGLVARLHGCEPQDLLADESHYPKINAKYEEELKSELLRLPDLTTDKARERIARLESQHGLRRDWVWFARGDAPLAGAIASLAALASAIDKAPSSNEPDTLGKLYADTLCDIDWRALQAIASVKTQADLESVIAALRAVYVPWLSDLAVSFQTAVMQQGYPGLGWRVNETGAEYSSSGECMLFVDGLRFDVGKELASRLKGAGLIANLGHGWTPFPPVTESGKAWVSPIFDQVVGRATDEDFAPSLKAEDKPLSTHYFRKLLQDAGWQILKGFDVGDPTGKAWAEFGDLDHFGHEHGLRLAHEIERVCRDLVERVQALFDAGWKRVTLVTDHGWLLVPGSMPKVELGKYLTDTRWGRCAVLKPGAQAPGPVLGWGWRPEVAVASAPGISAHRSGLEYAHGGLSLQECLVPVIDVQPGTDSKAKLAVTITELKWVGLRCRIQADNEQDGYQADLRSKANDPSSTFCGGAKPLKGGKASLAVLDDDNEGTAAMVVILNAQGSIVSKQSTVIGG